MNKLWRWLILVLVVVILAGGGYLVWQQKQRATNHENLIKTANSLFPEDARYVSFGADYVFAVPKSYTVDESSVAGVQLLIPGEGGGISATNFDQLYDAAVVAVQPIAQIKANSNKSVKDYVNKTIIPDLKKNVSADVTIKYAISGKYLGATIVATKDGKQVRQLYIYGGSHPFTVVAASRSDALNEVVATLVGIPDWIAKDDYVPIKTVVQADMALLQSEKPQELFDAAAAEFKQKTSVKDITNAINNSKTYIHRNIVIPGGTIQGDQFVGQLYFPPANKDEQPSGGSVSLRKEGGQWKLNGFTLPTPPPPAPTTTPKK